jgi:hypothetical protein
MVRYSPLTTIDILAVTHAKDIPVADLVKYLDTDHYPGIFREWAMCCVRSMQPFLETVITFDEELIRVLRDPMIRFNTADPEVARKMACRRVIKGVHDGSPTYLKYAMAAYIDFGLGELESAVGNVECSQCERHTLYFEDVMDTDTKASSVALRYAAEQLAKELLPVLQAKRREAKSVAA